MQKILKILLLYPDRVINSIKQIRCFSDVYGYYLGSELARHTDTHSVRIPSGMTEQEMDDWFQQLDVTDYDAVIAFGLRYFSTIPSDIAQRFRRRLDHQTFLCQIYDGSRLDNDPVDITFTVKNDDINEKYFFGSPANRYVRHRACNAYIGWAADPDLNCPEQSKDDLRILIDHTNYAQNPIDSTQDIILEIKRFVDSGIWKPQWKSVTVRRFGNGQVLDVDLNDPGEISRYDRSTIPFTEVCQEHRQAHIFCVTHPESVGLVVLETATAGAIILVPDEYISADRLATVRHVSWKNNINWASVLKKIDPEKNRAVAIKNSWEAVAKRVRDEIRIRQIIRGARHD